MMPDQDVRYADLLTSDQVAALYGVTIPALYLWRQRLGMPYVRIPGYRRDSIRFRLADVLKWGVRNGKQLVNPPADVSRIDPILLEAAKAVRPPSEMDK
jgi:hypothetical protein